MSSCIFQPDENLVQLSQKPLAKITEADFGAAYLLNTPDTFALFARSTGFFYDLDIENAQTAEVIVYIDGQFLTHNAGAWGTFQIYAPNYDDGYHNIKLEVLTNSGTGSLADKLGGEQVLSVLEWTFVLKRKAPEPINVLKAYAEDGRLVVEWETGDVLTEKKLEFEYKRNNASDIKWSRSIFDPYQTRIVDSLYFGGELNITLRSYSIDPVYPSRAKSLSINHPHPEIVEYSSDGYGHLTLKWNRSPFYRNVAKYTVIRDGIIIESDDGSDTVGTTDQIPFTGYGYVRLSTIAKNLDDSWGQVYEWNLATVQVGERRNSSMRDIIHAPLKPEFGFQTDNRLNEFQVLYKDSVQLAVPMNEYSNIFRRHMTISAYGEYLYFAFNSKIMRMDRSGNITTALDIEQVYGKAPYVGHLTLGDDRYLCFADLNYTDVVNVTTYMYDLQENKPVFEKVNPDKYDETLSMQQSPDGKYLIEHHTFDVAFHTLSNGEITDTKIFRNSYNAVFFNTAAGNNQVIFMNNPNEITIYDPETGTSVTNKMDNTDLVYSTTYTYDPVTGYIGTGINYHYMLIDPVNAVLLRKILIGGNYKFYPIYNGSLYSGFSKLDLQL